MFVGGEEKVRNAVYTPHRHRIDYLRESAENEHIMHVVTADVGAATLRVFWGPVTPSGSYVKQVEWQAAKTAAFILANGGWPKDLIARAARI